MRQMEPHRTPETFIQHPTRRFMGIQTIQTKPSLMDSVQKEGLDLLQIYVATFLMKRLWMSWILSGWCLLHRYSLTEGLSVFWFYRIQAPFQTETAEQIHAPFRPTAGCTVADYILSPDARMYLQENERPVAVIGSSDSGCAKMRKNNFNLGPVSISLCSNRGLWCNPYVCHDLYLRRL